MFGFHGNSSYCAIPDSVNGSPSRIASSAAIAPSSGTRSSRMPPEHGSIGPEAIKVPAAMSVRRLAGEGPETTPASPWQRLDLKLMSPAVAPGSTISHYRIEAELGRGGMGVVYRATDTLLGRAVALKVVHAEPLAHESAAEARGRFLREAQFAGAANHPALVTVYGFERVNDDAVIVMELLEGETLAQQLARKQPWTPVHTAMLLAAVADGVAEAHRIGIVHRDLKPGNIMLLPDGRVKVLDFGIAGLAYKATESGPVVGTVEYMAPEQVTNGSVGPAADVFALGAIAYEMMTLERAFGVGSTEQIALRVAGDDPPLIADSRAAEQRFGPMRPILERMLRKSAQARYADGSALLDALAPIAYQMSPESGVIVPVTYIDPASGPLTGSVNFPAPKKALPASLVAALAASVAIAIGAAALYAFGGQLMGRMAGVTPIAPPAGAGGSIRARPAPVAPAPAPAPITPPVVVRRDTTPLVALPVKPVEHRVLVSSIDVTPAGATIRRLGGDRRTFKDHAELSITAGDSVQLSIEHPKYDTRRVWYKGRPLRIALGSGTGTVTLRSNMVSTVELRSTDGSENVLASGQTPLTTKLAPGTYRATFRARSFDDSTRMINVKDGSESIVSIAYVATGTLMVEIIGGAAATLRVDGGDARPAPAEFPALSPGRHVVSVERGGLIARDTVVIFPGRRTARKVVAP